MRKKIVILGNGKLTKAFVLGLIRAGYYGSDILVIGREKSNLSFFQKLSIETSRNMKDAEGIPYVFLMVTPQGVGPQLVRMKEINVAGIKQLVSFASGLNVEVLAKTLDMFPARVAVATTNTNLEYGKGLILTNGRLAKESMETLGLVGLVTPEQPWREIVRGIVAVGSMNAIDTSSLGLMWRNEKTPHQNLRSWLDEVHYLINPHNDFKILTENSKHVLLKEYVKTKALVLHNCMGYPYLFAKKHACITLSSTVSSLLRINNLEIHSFKSHTKKVVTTGGCTEEGIRKLVHPSVIVSEIKLQDVVAPMHKRSKLFQQEVIASIETAMK